MKSMNFLSDIFNSISKNRSGGKAPERVLSEDEMAEMLSTSPEALKAFENAYHTAEKEEPLPDSLFSVNAKEAAKLSKKDVPEGTRKKSDKMIENIVSDLLSETSVLSYQDSSMLLSVLTPRAALPCHEITDAEIKGLPLQLRPQLTGDRMSVDINGNSAETVLWMYKKFKETGNRMFYNEFRQGLDILDLDPVMYEIIGMNKNSIGYWFPPLAAANKDAGHFFKIPDTKIMKVPITLLQLTRKDYAALTETTKKIVDRFTEQAFQLDLRKEYFVKTGTYSSKYDFRNCHVKGKKEVHELGEYLLFIHFQALQMASPLSKPCIYGVSTTNEWTVRDFVKDKENALTIYNGLLLHTEYRFFIDCDKDTVLGCADYWDKDVMEKRFSEKRGLSDVHDAITFKAAENVLHERFDKNKETLQKKVEELLPHIHLHGQWSLDIMQNGDDFYLIDMALAENSAYYGIVPKELRAPSEENWIPEIPNNV